MSRFGVAPAEDISGVVDGEIRRIVVGPYVIIEVVEEMADGFPGLVFDSEVEAREAATREAGLAPPEPGEG
jgi:hypothetical protein